MPIRSRLLLLALACGPLLAACQASAPVRAPAPPAAVSRAVPADDNLNAVLWMQRSEEYRALVEQTWRAAGDLLEAALADPDWSALVPEERASTDPARKPAVVVDVDETVLDNTPYQARLVIDGGEYTEPTWDAWVEQRRARALPGAVAFARRAAAKGVTMIYVSNRSARLGPATLDNLRAVGLPVADDSVFLGLGTAVPGCVQHGSEKDCRRRLVSRRYRVLMQFGDQLGDFVAVPGNTPQVRAAVQAKYRDWFGQRWWLLPNPSYGGWEAAAFGNDWTRSRAQRRAAKRAALEPAR